MDDFARMFRDRIEAARATHDRETAEREEESNDRQIRASQLISHLERRFLEASQVDPQAVRYTMRAEGQDATVHELTWVAPLPARTLLARMEPSTDHFWWTWVYGGTTSGWSEIDALEITRRDIDALIEQLADQERWAQGEIPHSELGRQQGAA